MEKVQKKGFTLIELLVVIAIIAILSAIGLVALNGAREKARDAQRRSDIAQIRTALSLYYDDHGSTYPPMQAAGGDLSSDSKAQNATPNGVLTAGGALTSNYLAQALKAPTADAVAGTVDSAHNHYYYLTSLAAAGGAPVTAPAHYIVYTQLEAAGGTYYYGINEEGTVTDTADAKTSAPTCDSYTPANPVCTF